MNNDEGRLDVSFYAKGEAKSQVTLPHGYLPNALPTSKPMPLDQPIFHFSTPIEVRFSDLDAFHHVNNAVYFTYMEQARFQYLKRVGLFDGTISSLGIIIAEAACTYLAPIVFDQNIVIRVRATHLKNSSFVFEYSLDDADSGRVMATGRTVQVCFDYAAGSSMPIPAAWRERLERFERGE
jgi:acyl-CoA thioester hydrolase